MQHLDEVFEFGRLRDLDQTPDIYTGGRIVVASEAPAEAPPAPGNRPPHPEHVDSPDHPEHPEHPEHPHHRRPPSPRPHGEPVLTR
jgi:hypothetical protein